MLRPAQETQLFKNKQKIMQFPSNKRFILFFCFLVDAALWINFCLFFDADYCDFIGYLFSFGEDVYYYLVENFLTLR